MSSARVVMNEQCTCCNEGARVNFSYNAQVFLTNFQFLFRLVKLMSKIPIFSFAVLFTIKIPHTVVKNHSLS